MKNLSQSFYTRSFIFMALASIMLLQVGCSGVISSLDSYSGETLYKASVESKQEVLNFAPDIQAKVYQHLETEEKKQIFKKFQTDFVTRLVEENPNFAQEFHDKMHSGDRQKINEALTAAGRLVKGELQELTNEEEINAGNVVDAVLQQYQDQK